jgi:hypothetical protein
MNIELLEKVKNQILEHPESFNMISFEFKGVRCILGWAVKLGEVPEDLQAKFEVAGPIRKASYILDLTVAQCEMIGCTYSWPQQFRVAYTMVDGNTETQQRLRARIAAERIDHFIATEGKE